MYYPSSEELITEVLSIPTLAMIVCVPHHCLDVKQMNRSIPTGVESICLPNCGWSFLSAEGPDVIILFVWLFHSVN